MLCAPRDKNSLFMCYSRSRRRPVKTRGFREGSCSQHHLMRSPISSETAPHSHRSSSFRTFANNTLTRSKSLVSRKKCSVKLSKSMDTSADGNYFPALRKRSQSHDPFDNNNEQYVKTSFVDNACQRRVSRRVTARQNENQYLKVPEISDSSVKSQVLPVTNDMILRNKAKHTWWCQGFTYGNKLCDLNENSLGCFDLEAASYTIDIDPVAIAYRNNYISKEHGNFIAHVPNIGPLIMSVMREKCKITDIDLFKVLLRCEAGNFLKIFSTPFPESPLGIKHPNRIIIAEHSPSKWVSNIINREIKVSKWYPLVCLNSWKQILAYDEHQLNYQHKIGILYQKKGQTNESEMFSNNEPSEAFSEFLSELGHKVRLKDFQGFKGGLDTKNDATGTHSLYKVFRERHIMFHVSTMLAFNKSDPHQIGRKRFIGNDIVTIIFQDENTPFSPAIVSTNYTQFYAVIQPIYGENKKYKVSICLREEVEDFEPSLPETSVFEAGPEFIDFLLTKLINAEIACCKTGKFGELHDRTRIDLLHSLYADLKSSVVEKNEKRIRLPKTQGQKIAQQNKSFFTSLKKSRFHRQPEEEEEKESDSGNTEITDETVITGRMTPILRGLHGGNPDEESLSGLDFFDEQKLEGDLAKTLNEIEKEFNAIVRKKTISSHSRAESGIMSECGTENNTMHKPPQRLQSVCTYRSNTSEMGTLRRAPSKVKKQIEKKEREKVEKTEELRLWSRGSSVTSDSGNDGDFNSEEMKIARKMIQEELKGLIEKTQRPVLKRSQSNLSEEMQPKEDKATNLIKIAKEKTYIPPPPAAGFSWNLFKGGNHHLMHSLSKTNNKKVAPPLPQSSAIPFTPLPVQKKPESETSDLHDCSDRSSNISTVDSAGGYPQNINKIIGGQYPEFVNSKQYETDVIQASTDALVSELAKLRKEKAKWMLEKSKLEQKLGV